MRTELLAGSGWGSRAWLARCAHERSGRSERKWNCGGEVERERAEARRAADMAHSGRLMVPLAALVLLLWAAPGAHGRRSNVRVLTDENWTSLLEGEWMIEL